jgi:hypothetical protein
MELNAGSIHAYLLTLQIIQKSTCHWRRHLPYPDCIYRVLLASIRDKGICACPQCLIPLSRARNMGMLRDMKQRDTLARVDDEDRRRKVAIAREIIYEKNYAVNNDNVEALLREQSLVPTSVSAQKKLCPCSRS